MSAPEDALPPVKVNPDPCECDEPDGYCDACDDEHGHTCIVCGYDFCVECWESDGHNVDCKREVTEDGSVRAAPRDGQTADELRQALIELAIRAGRIIVELPEWPVGSPDGHGYVYAILFDDGMVKVGHTRYPSRRLGEFRRDASRYGRVILNSWLSRPTTQHLAAEGAMRAGAMNSGAVTRSGNEYFVGLDFGLACSIGERSVLVAEETA